MSNWEEFEDQCEAHIQRIETTKDDGLYAKLYARDVKQLLRMVQALRNSPQVLGDGATLIQEVFDSCRRLPP